MSKFNETVGQVGTYVSVFAITQVMSVAGSLIMRGLLGPIQTGVWSLVQVALTYTDYPNLGATYAIPVEIPAKKAQGKTDEADRMKNVIFSFSFLTSLVFACGVLVYAFWQRDKIPQELFFGLLIASGLVILQQMNNILISLLRAYKNFGLAGKQMILSSLVNFILVVSFSTFFRLYGFMLAMVLSFVFNICYILFHRPFKLGWNFDYKVMFGLIRYGFPLMLLGLVTTFIMTMDQVMIAHKLGVTALGLYSVAVMTNGFISSIPNSVGIVLLPNVSEKFAETGNVKNLKSYLEKSNHLFSVLMPVLIGIAWFWVPLMIHWVIPKFDGGIEALKYLTLSAFFFGVTQTYIDFIVVSKKHLWQFPISCGICVAALLVNLLAIYAGFGIAGIAAVKTLVLMLNFTTMFIFAGRAVFSLREMLREYLSILLSFVFMGLVLFVLDKSFQAQPDLFKSFMQSLLMGIVYFPVLWYAEKKHGVLKILKEKVLKRKSQVPVSLNL